jgi:hypothetical protein
VSGEEFGRGFDEGWLEADDFIERHPHGPWAALPEEGGSEPEDEFERGRRRGWRERMEEEEWPTSGGRSEGRRG